MAARGARWGWEGRPNALPQVPLAATSPQLCQAPRPCTPHAPSKLASGPPTHTTPLLPRPQDALAAEAATCAAAVLPDPAAVHLTVARDRLMAQRHSRQQAAAAEGVASLDPCCASPRWACASGPAQP